MDCRERKSGICFYVEGYDDLKEQFEHFYHCDEFLKKYGEPEIEVDGAIVSIDDLDVIKKQKRISEIATDIVKTTLNKFDYENEGEVALYAANSASKWHNEALSLQHWIEEVYQKMYFLQDAVADKNVNLEDIVEQFPKFSREA